MQLSKSSYAVRHVLTPRESMNLGSVARSGVNQIYRAKKVHLADIDAVVTENRVGSCEMEVRIGYGQLQQVVGAADNLAGRRPGDSHLALARTGVLRLFHALRKFNRFLDALTQIINRLLSVFVLRRRLAGQSCSRELDVVTSALNLLDEMVLVRRETAGHQDGDVILFQRRVLLCLIEPSLDVFECLRALCNHLIEHGIVSRSHDLRSLFPP